MLKKVVNYVRVCAVSCKKNIRIGTINKIKIKTLLSNLG